MRLYLGDEDGALKDLDMAIELRGSQASYYQQRSTLRRKLGDHAGARRDLDMALRLDPTILDKRL